MNLLLTGEKQVGKTKLCTELIKLMRTRNLNPTGLLTPALYNNSGKKVGFFAFNISNGESWLLASTEQEFDGPRVGNYSFNQLALERAIEVLTQACHYPQNLLLLDEIGPLELKQQGGFFPILNLLPLNGQGHLLLVVRTASLSELQQRLTPASFQIVEVTTANRDSIPQQLITKLYG